MTPGQIASFKAACAEYDGTAEMSAALVTPAQQRVLDRTAAAVKAAHERISTAIDALLKLHELVDARPDIASAIKLDEYGRFRFNAPVGSRDGDIPGLIAEIAEAARERGATLATHVNQASNFGGIAAAFGPFELYIYAELAKIGTTVTREVETWAPDARLAALGTDGAA